MKLRNYQLQAIQEIQKNYQKGNKHVLVVAPCGAGKSVIIADCLKRTIDKGNRALFLVHRKELIDQIKDTLHQYGVDGVDLITVQSLARRLDDTDYKLIVTDETHHSLANSYRKIYDHYSNAYRLGFTATPIRLSGAGLGDIYDCIVETPDAKWMIENNYLSPYKYLAPSLIDTMVLKMRMGEYTKASIDKAMSGVKVYGGVIKHYKEYANGKKAIVYCASVKHAERVAEEFRANGIKALSVDAKTKDRDIRVDLFRKGKIDVITNVDLFGEGFDVPDCECVILLRPTSSLSLYIQQSMRSMRFRPNKEALILDHVGNVYTHGLPDDHREWSLKGTEKPKENSESLITCRKCLSVYRHGTRCPNCGGIREIEQKKIEVIEDVSLIDVGDAKNAKDLYAIAKNKGYKPGWAYYQAIRMGFIKGDNYHVKIKQRS